MVYSWFTVAKRNVSQSQSKLKIKEELKKLQLKEERISKLKERAKKNLELQECKGSDFGRPPKLDKVDGMDDELLIEDYGDNDIDESVEEPCEEMVTYLFLNVC